MRCIFCKLLNYEYWPWYIWHSLVFPIHVFNAIKCKSVIYFTVLNPSLGKTGGFFGDLKSEIALKFPKHYALKETVIATKMELDQLLKNNTYPYPFVVKPDAGERGEGVQIITNAGELKAYFTCESKYNVIVQEFANYSHEFGIFVYNDPAKGWLVSGVNGKIPFEVIGDGVSTLHQLMQSKCRYRMQIENLAKLENINFKEILPKGEKRRLSNIQNHRLGAEFINTSNLINEKFSSVILGICAQIPGFNYGRFDIKANSFDEIANHNFKIIELNGAAAEQTVIYDQKNTGFFKGLSILAHHILMQGKIAKQNINQGHKPLPWSDFKSVMQLHFLVK